jgi:hypothetical protein
VKVTPGLNAANLIPGNYVTNALADLKVAVWAHPGFAVVGIRPDAGLSRVVNATLCLAAANS